MSINQTIWKVPIPIIHKLKSNNLPPELLTLISRRGINNQNELDEYIEPKSLPNVYDHFPQLEKAITRILISQKHGEQVCICGDYDADGMTSTTLLLDVLKRLDINVFSIIPSRNDDGYGLNINIVKKVEKLGVKVIITVDNGISAIDSLDYAYSRGIDVIVTDHHKIQKKVKNIYALIHPETNPINSPYKYLAGVGLAYILATELGKRVNNNECLRISNDLLCIGTIADMAKLKGANRYWLKSYIPNLKNTKSLGLRRLISKVFSKEKELNSEDISFYIAPRINSVGRISDPKLIVSCLLEDNKQKANELADRCEEINKQRKNISKRSTAEAIDILDNQLDLPFIILAQSHWHHGIIGLIAARLMEKYKKPTAILAKDTDGLLRGSVRSPKYFDVSQALESCSGFLEKHGGHACAGGFTVKAENFKNLEDGLIKYAQKQNITNNLFTIEPEVYITLDKVNHEFIQKLKLLEPFGMGNQKPIFWTRGCELLENRFLYGGHQILTIKQEETVIHGIKWNRGERISIPKKLDIAFNIEPNHYNKNIRTQITIIGAKPYKEKEVFKAGDRIYKCYINDKDNLNIINEVGKKLTYNLLDKEINPPDIEYNDYIKHLISTAKASLGIQD